MNEACRNKNLRKEFPLMLTETKKLLADVLFSETFSKGAPTLETAVSDKVIRPGLINAERSSLELNSK